jgi:hypothetical protein
MILRALFHTWLLRRNKLRLYVVILLVFQIFYESC